MPDQEAVGLIYILYIFRPSWFRSSLIRGWGVVLSDPLQCQKYTHKILCNAMVRNHNDPNINLGAGPIIKLFLETSLPLPQMALS